MGYTKTGDPFVSNYLFPVTNLVERPDTQVGPVLDPTNPDAYKGQYISAGYTGHGMPRAFSW